MSHHTLKVTLYLCVWVFGLPLFSQQLPMVQKSPSCELPRALSRTNDSPGVWSDFIKAHHELTYDLKKREVRVKSTLLVTTFKRGYPLFDLVDEPSKITLDGKAVTQKPQDLPGKASTVRRLTQVVEPGAHKIVIWSRMNTDVLFSKDTKSKNSPNDLEAHTVESRFRFYDLRDRSFLEKYLPANLEFDQYAMTIEVKILGKNKDYEIFTNGKLSKTSDGFEIQYPKHFTSSSPFFHLTPKGRYSKVDFAYTSIDGRSLPVTIYTNKGWFGLPVLASVFKLRLLGLMGLGGILPEVERRFGPWPHPSFVVFGHNKLFGGMEYPGAAESSHMPFRHEVVHNYFGRSVMPCDGETGWLDEAIASWNDFKAYHALLVKIGLVDHSKEGIVTYGESYLRATPRGSYLQGRHFVTEVQRQLAKSPKGPKTFDQFLRIFHQKYKLSQVSARQFLKDLEDFSGIDFRPVAETYIYKKTRLPE